MGGNQSTVETSELASAIILPTVGRIVHYVASSTLVAGADGKTYPDVRAMLITGVNEDPEGNITINGMIFRRSPGDQAILSMFVEAANVKQDELELKVGTWHWPIRK